MVLSYRYPGLVMYREKAMELGRFTVLKSEKPGHLGVLRPFHVHGRAFLVSFPTCAACQELYLMSYHCIKSFLVFWRSRVSLDYL